MYTNATIIELNRALELVNERFNNNIKFKRLDNKGNRKIFTLTVKNSKDAGGRIGFTGKRVAAACWHAHGYFFDALFSINENIYIYSMGKKITADSGNWQDKNIGSIMSPLYYSQACKC